MLKNTNIKELAKHMVGDGKKPNRYFVTIAYGWYRPLGDDADAIQVDRSLESVTVLFTNKQQAIDFYDNIPMEKSLPAITRETIANVMVEDRLTGVIRDKMYEQTPNNRFELVMF